MHGSLKLSIRQKLFFTIVIPLLLIGAVALAFQFHSYKKSSLEQAQAYAEQIAAHYAARIDGQLAQVAQVAKSTAAFLSIQPHLSEKEIFELLGANVRQNPLVYGSCLALEPYAFERKRLLFGPYVFRGKAGLQQLDVGRDAYDYRGWDWYRLPVEQKGALWTEPFFDQNAGNVVMSTHAVPIYRDGKIWGVTTVDLRLEDLQRICGVTELQDSQFAIFSRNGTVISHPNPAFIMKETLFSLAAKDGRRDLAEMGRHMIAGETGLMRLPGIMNAEPHWFFYAPIPSVGWSFAAVVPEARIMAPAYSQLRTGIISVIVALSCMIGAVFVVAIRITRPIKRLAITANAIAGGNLDVPAVIPSDDDEIGDLALAFNKMVRDLKSYIQSLTQETVAREAMESEVRLARNVQISLLPHTFPPFPDHREFDLYASNAPAKYVAGDFFDYFFVEPHLLTVVIADVSGKGVAAAMFMAVVRTLIRNLAKRGRSPGQILSEANQTLVDDDTRARFVTIFLGQYNIRTGKLLYASAGHLPPYCLKAAGEPAFVGEATGTILGMLPGLMFEERSLQLNPGDLFLLYTDGVTEARSPSGDFFGSERLAASVRSLSQRSASEICQSLVEEVLGFQAQQPHDDITILALNRTGSA